MLSTMTRRTPVLVRCAAGGAVALLGLGCAQVFGFDDVYELRGGDSEGGGGVMIGTSGNAGGGSPGAGAGGPGGPGGGGEGGVSTNEGGAGGGDRCKILEVSPDEVLTTSLIDDLEDGNIDVPEGEPANPRLGFWYTFNDMTGGNQEPSNDNDLVVPLALPREGSELAVHTSADDGFTEWGAGVGVLLRDGEYYDASAYSGITFWAYAEEDSSRALVVSFIDRQTDGEGGECGGEMQPLCYDHFHSDIILTPSWKHYKIPIACLKQEGYGEFPALRVTELRSIDFLYARGKAFNIWIDDIAFYREEAGSSSEHEDGE
ncbi:uncharacterized protein SOCE26_073380 [Sorangium cellulosum]|uniref:CBM11 domain-containing protein n=1 Tax=Sorangium cellulosum TaxID=56 RepID=A0A2L0F2Q4_SORCE|nr:hypothetical protein [Sorangium cellulosum]AUX45842.1 uncharacterized protein SOCE26_073380 [Sorangium cellulosum]